MAAYNDKSAPLSSGEDNRIEADDKAAKTAGGSAYPIPLEADSAPTDSREAPDVTVTQALALVDILSGLEPQKRTRRKRSAQSPKAGAKPQQSIEAPVSAQQLPVANQDKAASDDELTQTATAQDTKSVENGDSKTHEPLFEIQPTPDKPEDDGHSPALGGKAQVLSEHGDSSRSSVSQVLSEADILAAMGALTEPKTPAKKTGGKRKKKVYRSAEANVSELEPEISIGGRAVPIPESENDVPIVSVLPEKPIIDITEASETQNETVPDAKQELSASENEKAPEQSAGGVAVLLEDGDIKAVESEAVEPNAEEAETYIKPQPAPELREISASKKPVRRAVALRIICGVIIAALLAAICCYLSFLVSIPPTISGVEVSDELNEDNTVSIRLTAHTDNIAARGGVWCAMSELDDPQSVPQSDWKLTDELGKCEFNVTGGSYKVYALDSLGNYSESGEAVSINRVASLSLNRATAYLPLEATLKLEPTVIVLGNADDTVSWSSSDNSVATVKDGVVTAVSKGEATITASAADGASAETLVTVSDIFTLPNFDTYSKPMLGAGAFTDEEAAMLDDILFEQVDEAGYGTRGGAIAAARFLTLQFPYRVPYFFENGRMSPHPGRWLCDGEGRYYHQGLYLSHDKFDDLAVSRYGPATWGELLMNFETKYAFVGGQRYPNGLDCSGFVCWCLINGGSDVGDMGAGDEYGDNDLCDLAPKKWLSADLLASDDFKVGDLIAEDGHMAIIIGLTDEEIYIAESLFTSVRVTHFKRNYSVIASGLYTYIIPMDDIYVGEGVYEDMWDPTEAYYWGD